MTPMFSGNCYRSPEIMDSKGMTADRAEVPVAFKSQSGYWECEFGATNSVIPDAIDARTAKAKDWPNHAAILMATQGRPEPGGIGGRPYAERMASAEPAARDSRRPELERHAMEHRGGRKHGPASQLRSARSVDYSHQSPADAAPARHPSPDGHGFAPAIETKRLNPYFTGGTCRRCCQRVGLPPPRQPASGKLSLA